MKSATLLKLPKGLQEATAIRQKAQCGLHTSATCPTFFLLCYFAKVCMFLWGFFLKTEAKNKKSVMKMKVVGVYCFMNLVLRSYVNH